MGCFSEKKQGEGRTDFFDKSWQRSSLCGDFGTAEAGSTVRANGWVRRRRDLGGIIFIELWDYTGSVQVVFGPEAGEVHERAGELRNEYCIAVRGTLRVRPEGTENPALKTGSVEIVAEDFLLLSSAAPLPFEVGEGTDKVDENLRLSYRYLDLRRERMQRNLRIRSRMNAFTRAYLDGRGFMEVETPILTKATPEGARD